MPQIHRIEVGEVPRERHLPDDLPLAGRLLRDDAFDRIIDLYRRDVRFDARAAPHNQIDWEWAAHQVRQNVRNVLTDDQNLYLTQVMAEWVKFTADLVDAAVAAEASVTKAVAETSALRQAQMAFAGRVIWAVLTTAAPPPFGAMAGAVVRGMLTQEKWNKCFSISAEWILQAPWPHTGLQADALGEWRPWVPGKSTKSPNLNYIGGHPSLRELKDYHKLLDKITDPMTPGMRDVFDKINGNTLSAAMKLPKPPAVNAHFRETIHEHLTGQLHAIRTGIREAMVAFGAAHGPSMDLARAIYYFLYFDDDPSRPPPSPTLRPSHPQSAPAHDTPKTNRVVHGIDLFLNTYANKLVQDVAAPLRNHRVPKLDIKAAQEVFERMYIARYLADNREPPTGLDDGLGEDLYRASDGVIPGKLLQGPLERRMQELRIVRKFGGAMFGFGRTADYQSAVDGWRPPFPDGDWIPVPYQEGGRNARGRLATWALNVRALHPDVVMELILRQCR